MSNTYYEYTFTITPFNETAQEILLGVLSTFPFESFMEHETGIIAYTIDKQSIELNLENDFIFHLPDHQINYTTKKILQENWNQTWEQNFEPIMVDEQCYVRAPFHNPIKNIPYEIIIEPKMSFGTGHHETTAQMISHILKLDCTQKNILDMGCGTAILAILTKMKGAKKVIGIDIDEWAYHNAIENCNRNQTPVEIILGDASAILSDVKYDLILANINRNILLDDVKIYVKHLKNKGILLTSGYFEEDLAIIKQQFNKFGLQFVTHTIKNRWVSAQFVKA